MGEELVKVKFVRSGLLYACGLGQAPGRLGGEAEDDAMKIPCSHTLNRRRNTLVAGAALVLFALVYYSLIYRYGLNLADEGNVGLISPRLMHRERPFLDVSPGYNVLWFYPISTLFRLFGTNLLLMRAYFYGILTVSGLIAFMLLRRLDT